MLSHEEREEIRREVYRDLAEMHNDGMAGSYKFLCLVDGDLLFTHRPIGKVIRDL